MDKRITVIQVRKERRSGAMSEQWNSGGAGNSGGGVSKNLSVPHLLPSVSTECQHSLVPYSLWGFIIILFDVPIFIGLTDCGGVTTLSHTI